MDTKYQFWLEYNSSMDSFFVLALLLAGAIIGLIWLFSPGTLRAYGITMGRIGKPEEGKEFSAS